MIILFFTFWCIGSLIFKIIIIHPKGIMIILNLIEFMEFLSLNIQPRQAYQYRFH